MRRQPRAAAFVLAAALLLGACGRDTNDGQDQAKPVSEGKATGEITVWAMGVEGEKLGAFAQEFSKENPDAKVNVTAVPWDAAHQKIASAIAGKQTPDVSMIGSTWMGEFAKTGALDPTPSMFDKAGYFTGAWDTTVVGGTSYAVPWYVETRAVYYRKDLAQKAGITAPPQTWDELKAMAKALQQRGGAQWGLYLQPGGTGSWETFLPFAWSNGAEIAKDGRFTFDTPELVEALAYYQSFYTEKVTPTDLPIQGALEQGFVNGSIGAFVSGPWHAAILNEQGGPGFADKYAVAAMPKKKSATSFAGGSNLAVFKDAKNRDAAWKFVAWLSRPEVQVRWFQAAKDLPAVQKSWDDSALSGDPILSTFGTQLKDTKAPPAVATWEQVAAALDTEVEKAAKAGESPAAAAKAVQDKAGGIGTGA
jgi:multiple sugar transport system substrate-binding protein